MPVHPMVERLREAIADALWAVKSYELPKVCTELGLEEGTEAEAHSSKRSYVRNRLSFDREALLKLAYQVQNNFPHYDLEETLWLIDEQTKGSRRTTEPTRRNILNTLVSRTDLPGHLGLPKTLERVMTIPSAIVMGGYGYRGPPSHGVIFSSINFLSLSEKRFFRILEAIVNPPSRYPADGQQDFVDALNEHLRRDKLELRQYAEESGYPLFRVEPSESARGVKGRPKNIIFASTVKPDLRFVDAINNDIEIATHAENVLVFDRPIPEEGLRWRDLQRWWAEREKLEPTARETKESLYKRLFSSLPQESPPQRFFFRTFYGAYKETFEDLPALLPEVWLHYDPKTVAQRGRDALLRQRMDFLMLFSHGVRIVIEVDGKQHYADAKGKADPAAYARMVAADRELRLACYEVYRFGAVELQEGSEGEQAVKAFFTSLFAKHPL
ncbi:MAG TPA: hypothetical protein VEX38_05145, partial [Fimbriimonadaceae bacterium]|nr:hypothetical protein [Fimbriimonadaceae bacterium]